METGFIDASLAIIDLFESSVGMDAAMPPPAIVVSWSIDFDLKELSPLENEVKLDRQELLEEYRITESMCVR